MPVALVDGSSCGPWYDFLAYAKKNEGGALVELILSLVQSHVRFHPHLLESLLVGYLGIFAKRLSHQLLFLWLC